MSDMKPLAIVAVDGTRSDAEFWDKVLERDDLQDDDSKGVKVGASGIHDGMEALKLFATVRSGADGKPSVRASDLFKKPAVSGMGLALNRKTTQNAVESVPIDDLEPGQETIAVAGLEAYVRKPRRDPADVARIVMRDGRTRLIVQEGHTRIGAAKLRGETTVVARIWEYTQNAAGGFDPVPRGIHARGLKNLSYRERLALLTTEVVDLSDDESALAKAGIVSIQVLDREGAPIGEKINLPNIADVQFPSMVGAVPSKPPKKRRKKVQYRGVSLGRQPMHFEALVLSLTEIPARLDSAVDGLVDGCDLLFTMTSVAEFGAREVHRELVRQGAPEGLMDLVPVPDVTTLAATVTEDRGQAFALAEEDVDRRLSRKRLSDSRRAAIRKDLVDFWEPGIRKRFANRSVNEAFAFGRATAMRALRRTLTIQLANRDETGKFESEAAAVSGGDIAVDAVIQTAVMDTNTCEECEAVDGEQMELGDARQEELHPPYVRCLGGDRCRCIQIAILSNGTEINVDEIDEDTIK